MEPNLENREYVVLLKPIQTIQRGSVIIFDAKGEDPTVQTSTNYVKRVIGIPGDSISSKNGILYVNNRRVNQDYISNQERNAGTGNWSLTTLAKNNQWTYSPKKGVVPKGCYFVLGDNRSVSNDSRYWGFVYKDKIQGIVKDFYWKNKQQKYNINKLTKNFFYGSRSLRTCYQRIVH